MWRKMCIYVQCIPTSCLPTLLIFIHIEHIYSFFVAFFSATIDGRNLIFRHKLHIGTPWIWRVQKRFPRYGVPIWSWWPNIRSLPLIVTEKNATKNGHIQNVYKNQQNWQTGSRNLMGQKTFPTIFFLSNYWWQKSDISSQASYRYPILWKAFLDPSDSYFLFANFVDFYTHWT
jgi:hypothetical protein